MSNRYRAHNFSMRLLSLKGSGGARRDRTADLLRARQALSQLSYGPIIEFALVDSSETRQVFGRSVRLVGLGGFEPPTSSLSGMRSNQLSYRPSRCRLMSEAPYYTQVKWIYNQYSGRYGQQGEGRRV